jgi:hypothetical protein
MPRNDYRFVSTKVVSRLINRCTKHPRIFSLAMLVGLCLLLLQIMPSANAGSEHAQAAHQRKNLTEQQAQSARLSDEPSMKVMAESAAVSLSDGRDLLTTYQGDSTLSELLLTNQAQALTLTSADFDEDGVADLVSGYQYRGGAMLTLHRGNVDALDPHRGEAKGRRESGTYTDAPFLSPASIIRLPVAPELMGAGDFDADGHWDVVVANRGGERLYLMSGDGHGNLRVSKEIALNGGVTALATGEINRRDGLTDIVVGVVKGKKSEVQVFEGPNGALRSEAEKFQASAKVTSLALGQLTAGHETDLAVAAGKELLLIEGRDRKLTLDEAARASIEPARMKTFGFAAALEALVAGDFVGDLQTDLAVSTADGSLQVFSRGMEGTTKRQAIEGLSGWFGEKVAGEWQQASRLIRVRVSASGKDDLVLVDSVNNQAQIITSGKELDASGQKTGGASSALKRTATLESTDAPVAVLPMTLDVDGLSDLVVLKSNASAPSVMMTKSAQIAFVVTNTLDSGAGSLRQAIIDTNNNPGTDTINFNIPGSGVRTISLLSQLPTITDAVTIDATTNPGFTSNPIIELEGSSTSASGLLIQTSNCLIKGLVINRMTGHGIIIIPGTSNNVIEGNFIGLNSAGTTVSAIGFSGIFAEGSNHRFGGTTAGARNVVAGVGHQNIALAGTDGALVQGNYSGTDATGSFGLGGGGVSMFNNSPNNTIGGTTAGARNVISGGSGSLHINSEIAVGNANNVAQGNYIGLKADGSGPTTNPATVGITICDNNGNLVGGTTPAARNIISGINGAAMLLIKCAGMSTGTHNNRIEGNYIGTSINGLSAIANNNGIILNGGSSNNTIGGATSAARNVISGNNSEGISLGTFQGSANNNTVQNNYIGTQANGTVALPNTSHGITISSANNIIGGATTGNVISGNGGNGIFIFGGATGNQIRGNKVGVDANGAAMGNGDNGMSIRESSNNLIGGATSDGNVFANNSNNGVIIDAGSGVSTSNRVTSNIFYNNIQGGIILINANNNQAAPVLNSATPGPSGTLDGTLTSTPSSTFSIEYFWNDACHPTGSGEGKNLISGFNVTTNGAGTTNFSVPLHTVPAGKFITATATNISNNNTSRFSQCRQMVQTYSISGQILEGTQGLGGVTVSLTGAASASTSTDAGGNYTFTGLTAGGNYTITPTKTDYKFSPELSNINNLQSNLVAGTSTNFSAFPQNVATPTGTNVPVQAGNVSLNFSQVNNGGTTTAKPIDPNTAGSLPPGFGLGGNGAQAFDITTTAAVTGLITTCFRVPEVNDQTEFENLRVLHGEGNTLVDRTASVDFANRRVCAATSSLSPFVVGKALSFLRLTQTSYSVAEGQGFVSINVTREGDVSGAATVGYRTTDDAGLTSCTSSSGKASERCDYATTLGTLRWNAGESGNKSFSIPIVDDRHADSGETFVVLLTAANGASVGAARLAIVTITDNNGDSPTAENPINEVQFYINQQYLDSLGRLPDATGFQNWVTTLSNCPGGGYGTQNPDCDRIKIAMSTFQSDEFQTRGYWAYRFYEVAFGRRPTYAEFIPDMALVGGPKSPAEEALSKSTFTEEMVLRGAFTQRYGTTQSNNTAYVDAILAAAGLPNLTIRNSLISGLENRQKTRGQVLREIVETKEVEDKFYVRGFVSLMYYGFLRRDPDQTGFNNYVNQLNTTWDPRKVTFDFIYSEEYLGRFGKP